MKGRLSILYFLQFSVWGCYLTSLGQFLGTGGLGKDIAWFYAAIGIVSVITPALMGHIADRYIRPVRVLGICHLTAGLAMLGMWIYAVEHPKLDFGLFFPLYVLFLTFYMPTMALSNTAAFAIIKSRGGRPVDSFPAIRVWGTVGFICAMWMVNSTYWYEGNIGWTLSESHPFASYRFQYSPMQLFCAGCLGVLTGLYTFVLPAHGNPTSSGRKGLGLFKIFDFKTLKEFFVFKPSSGKRAASISRAGLFLIFVAFMGVCMQISNGYATPFISHFLGDSDYSGSFAAGNATMLFSLSQISEATVILTVGKALNKWGIGTVFGLGILAWSLRFLFFATGNPDNGLVFLVLSMIVYGFAFNFITVAGHLHMEAVSPEGSKGLGQGVMMLMGNGIGATAGILAAGSVINSWCSWEIVEAPGGAMRLFMGEWTIPWLIFSAYSITILCAWYVLYVRNYTSANLDSAETHEGHCENAGAYQS